MRVYAISPSGKDEAGKEARDDGFGSDFRSGFRLENQDVEINPNIDQIYYYFKNSKYPLEDLYHKNINLFISLYNILSNKILKNSINVNFFLVHEFNRNDQ